MPNFGPHRGEKWPAAGLLYRFSSNDDWIASHDASHQIKSCKIGVMADLVSLWWVTFLPWISNLPNKDFMQSTHRVNNLNAKYPEVPTF